MIAHTSCCKLMSAYCSYRLPGTLCKIEQSLSVVDDETNSEYTSNILGLILLESF